MSSGPTSARGTSWCRGCGASPLTSVLDLGSQPLSNELVPTQETVPDTFPLHLRICRHCGLGQVGEYVLPDRIFGDEYPYLSSTSAIWVAHAQRYADQFTERLGLDSDDLVLEVASNDGYLLSAFQNRGMPVLGIEPARNVARLAQSSGVPTITEFFGKDCALRVVAEHAHPRLVAANNVMAHVPDLHDFVAGLALLADDRTLITIENPSLVSLLREAQFDTIYHEHFSYLTATSVQSVARAHGLELIRVETLPTHGGSNRYHLQQARSASPDPTVAEFIAQERQQGLFDADLWQTFAARADGTVNDLRRWLEERAGVGKRIAAYGAAAKGTTLLNAVGVTARNISFVVDGSFEKQGKFLPGPQIPVVDPARLSSEDIDDVLVLPWNLAAELVPIVRSLKSSAAVWVATPTMERLA